MSTKAQEYHHNLTTVLSREEKCVSKPTATIASYTNPFTQQGQDLFNPITKVVMPEELKRDLSAQSVEGAKLLNPLRACMGEGGSYLWAPVLANHVTWPYEYIFMPKYQVARHET